MKVRQKTLREPVSLEGVGLHGGTRGRVTLRPHLGGKGVLFRFSTDTEERLFPLSPEAAQGSFLCSYLSFGGFTVKTVEHLLSALSGLGIDQVEVVVEGEEVPILDGSSRLFIDAILRAGIIELNREKEALRISSPVYVSENESFAFIAPHESFRVTYLADYRHPWAGPMVYDGVISEAVYASDIAGARTFGFKKDVDFLRSQGLIKGGSLENAIAVGDDGYSSPLRYPDELIRHKVLDLIGDLNFLARPIQGHVTVFKGGHSLHSKLVKAIYQEYMLKEYYLRV